MAEDATFTPSTSSSPCRRRHPNWGSPWPSAAPEPGSSARSAAGPAALGRDPPIDRNSAGRKKGGSTGKGNPWLAGTLGEVIAGLSRTDTFLGERYRRLARRQGKSRAIVAAGNSVLTVVWHLLSDPAERYNDLGPDF
jgi:transposase